MKKHIHSYMNAFIYTVKWRVLFHLEAHAGFFRLSMKGKVDVYLLRPFENILASAIESCIDQRYLKKMATILFSYYQQRIVWRVLLLTLKFEITQQPKK